MTGPGPRSRLELELTVVLILAVLGAVGELIYVASSPVPGERFTEFYALGPEGKADGYPRDLAQGEQARVRLGVVNVEHRPLVYHLVIALDWINVRAQP